MTVLFLCGAAGSALGSMIYYHRGWTLTVWAGLAMVLAVAGIDATEWRRPATR